MQVIFHKLSDYMRVSLEKMCIEGAPVAHASGQLAMSKQRTTKKIKKELLCDKTVLAVSKKCIDALYYN